MEDPVLYMVGKLYTHTRPVIMLDKSSILMLPNVLQGLEDAQPANVY